MRIAVIGGGVSGMAAAWMLQHDHEVTLFERAPTLGGHVETVAVETRFGIVHAELGTRFFFDTAYPFFLALLRLLDVPTRWTDGRVSITRPGQHGTLILPPRDVRDLSTYLQNPRLTRHLLSLLRLVREQPRVAARRDFSVTLRGHLARAGYPASFGPELAFPFLAACWGAPLDRLPEFPAYSLLKGMSPGKRPGFFEVIGGMARYIEALRLDLARVELRLGVSVQRVHANGGLDVEELDGARHSFDHVIIATSSRDAAELLRDVPAAAELREAVGSFQHFDTEIVAHGDPSLMPPDPRDWAHNNLFFEGGRAWMTDWQGLRLGAPVFRTWLPKGTAIPSPLYGRRHYHHLLMTPENAVLQRRIRAHQGAGGVWVTGMYAVDVDNHESALLSAIVPVRALAPSAPNLRRLTAEVKDDAPHGLEVLTPPPAVAARER